MSDFNILVSAGDNTESLIQEILKELTNDQINEMDLERELEDTKGLTGEPITTAVVIGGSAIIVSAVVRVVERYMEHRQQEKLVKLVAEGFDKDPKLGNLLKDLSSKYADVAISHGIAKEGWKGH